MLNTPAYPFTRYLIYYPPDSRQTQAGKFPVFLLRIPDPIKVGVKMLVVLLISQKDYESILK
jgi:hypothetical protein